MNQFWTVTVQLEIENDRGRIQKIKENYLVDAVSPSHAEAKIYKVFEGKTNFTVTGVNKSKIIKVVD
jgi:hypothetical protein